MTTQTTFYISGLKCGGCIATAQNALKQVTGYESSDFDLDAGTMKVSGDIDPQAVSAAMSEVGYAAVVKSD
ncbi:MAG: heavy-metal-associated domain-containing protein [Gammaproteobacteria bacterium]|jgi:copper chaperone CopZ